MKLVTKMRIAFLKALFLFTIAQLAWGVNDQTLTANATQIRLQIVNGCLLNSSANNGVNIGTFNFGGIYATKTAVDAQTTPGNGSILLRCTPGTTAKITLGPGLYGTGVNDRRMRIASGTNTLRYQLYTSAARTTVWDDVTGISIIVNDNTTKTFPVYGRIPAQATPVNGNYSDQVMVTLTY